MKLNRKLRCNRCLSCYIVKNGTTEIGKQKYYCKSCGSYGVIKSAHTQTTSLLVFGTTSSGKSSIINLLLGEYLLPSGVQETTQIVTRIIQPPIQSSKIQAKSPLKILFERKSKNTFRTMQDVTFAREYLLECMSKTEDGLELEISVSQNTALKNSPTSIQSFQKMISPHSPFMFVDYPGINSFDDTYHASLLSEIPNDYTVIVFVFNAEEVDFKKEEKALKVFFQVLKNNQTSFANVIFVVNRIDSFYRDSGVAEAGEKIANIISQKKKIISDFSQELDLNFDMDNLNICGFSSGPLLAVELLIHHRGSMLIKEREFWETQVSSYANYLLPKSLLSNLPRTTHDWENWQWSMVINEIRKICRFSSLYQLLNDSLSKELKIGPIGGYGGTPFECRNSPLNYKIKQIDVYGFDYIDSIIVTYKGPFGDVIQSARLGGNGGQKRSFVLKEGEYLIGITGQYGAFIDNIQFHTNIKNSPVYGGAGGDQLFNLNVPNGYEIVGFFGHADWYLDQIGLIARPLAQ